jgi:Flp pilus assembly protein TadD
MWLRMLLLIAAGAAAYSNSFGNAFLFDDVPQIVGNPSIRVLMPLTSVAFPPPGSPVTGRPVVNLTLAVNYALGGLQVEGYHVMNLTLHLVAALLLFALLRRTFTSPRLKPHVGAEAADLALAAALLWTVHPLQTQSVTYVIQRAEILVGVCTLLVLYSVARAASSRRPAWWHAGAILACACGMGSKPVMVTAPLIALAYDRIFFSTSLAEVWRRRGPLYLGLAATWIWLAVLAALGPRIERPVSGYGIAGLSAFDYLLSQPGVILHYLRLAAWPAPLVFDYGWPVAKAWRSIAPAALGISVLLAAIGWALRRAPALAFAGLWFFGLLAPTSSIFPLGDLAVEHRMYLPLGAVVTLAVVAAHRTLAALVRFAVVRMAIAGSLVMALAGLGIGMTLTRNLDYRSTFGMWKDIVEKRPLFSRAHNNFGFELARKRRFQQAMLHYREAIRLKPDLAEAHNNLGVALGDLGREAEAVSCYREAIRLKPEYAEAHSNLGVALTHQDRGEEAIDAFQRAIELKPDMPELYSNLGVVLMNRNEMEAAIAQYEIARRLKPDHADTLVNLGVALTRQGRLEEAAARLAEAVRLNPASETALNNYGVTLLRLGRRREAIAYYQQALRLRPDYLTARRNLDEALAEGPLDSPEPGS